MLSPLYIHIYTDADACACTHVHTHMHTHTCAHTTHMRARVHVPIHFKNVF